MNKNYVKGRRKEYKIVKELKQQGYDIVQRTAGSHSCIDIFAIHKDTRKILFIQSKPDDYGIKASLKLKSELDFLNGSWFGEFQLV